MLKGGQEWSNVRAQICRWLRSAPDAQPSLDGEALLQEVAGEVLGALIRPLHRPDPRPEQQRTAHQQKHELPAVLNPRLH